MTIVQRLASPHWSLEPGLVAVMLLLAAVVFMIGERSHLLLSLFYLPVVVSAFCVGCYRSGAFALLSVLLAGVSIVAGSSHPLDTTEIFAFLIWGATLGLVAVVTGALADAWREATSRISSSLKSEVLTDALTGVANRRALDEFLAVRTLKGKLARKSISLLAIDIDNFKSFNDRFGHKAGDHVLAEVANLMVTESRQSDFVARFGGEEFTIVIVGQNEEVAAQLAERVRYAIQSSRFAYQSLSLRVTVSIGVAHLQEHENANMLMQRADSALYCSKEAGRNCIHIHNGSQSVRVGKREQSLSTKWKIDGRMAEDPVTGLTTLKVFLDELRRRMFECKRYHCNLCVAVIGIDYYHAAVNQDARASKDLIITVAKLATSVLRESDMAARCGESSICVLLPRTSMESCLVPLERLRQSALEYKDPRYKNANFELSIGIAELTEDVQGCERRFLDRADQAMNSASARGGNRICQTTMSSACDIELAPNRSMSS